MKNVKVSGPAVYLLCLAAVLALYSAFVSPGLRQKTEALNEEHEANQQQIALYSGAVQNRQTLRQSLSSLASRLKSARSSAGLASSGLGTDLNKGLAAAGAAADSITVSGETAAGGKSSSGKAVTQVGISMTLTCTDSQLKTLLDYYERKSDAVYVVTSLGATRRNPSGQTASGDLSVTLDMTAYYASPAAGAAP